MHEVAEVYVGDLLLMKAWQPMREIAEFLQQLVDPVVESAGPFLGGEVLRRRRTMRTIIPKKGPREERTVLRTVHDCLQA